VCGGDHAQVRILTRRPIEAAPDEAEANPRSRSAKLRVVERLGGAERLDGVERVGAERLDDGGDEDPS
jgi:hypothetical protein